MSFETFQVSRSISNYLIEQYCEYVSLTLSPSLRSMFVNSFKFMVYLSPSCSACSSKNFFMVIMASKRRGSGLSAMVPGMRTYGSRSVTQKMWNWRESVFSFTWAGWRPEIDEKNPSRNWESGTVSPFKGTRTAHFWCHMMPLRCICLLMPLLWIHLPIFLNSQMCFCTNSQFYFYWWHRFGRKGHDRGLTSVVSVEAFVFEWGLLISIV